MIGAIAQLVERVLCKHEVVGSIPSGSTNSLAIEENHEFSPGPLWILREFDTVNEGSSRREDLPVFTPALWRADLRRHHCLAKTKTKRMCDCVRSFVRPAAELTSRMSFAENDQAHKGF